MDGGGGGGLGAPYLFQHVYSIGVLRLVRLYLRNRLSC